MTVQEIVAANRYMTLATADEQGRPWATPVWFATADCRHFYWLSKPGARHSRNIGVRPEVGIVIFDSTVMAGEAKAVYVDATAALSDELGVYNAEEARQGLALHTAADVGEGARHRMYRATATAIFTLDERDERIPQAL